MRRDQRSPEALAYRRLYGTARWKRTRKAQLATEPLCRFCREEGRVTPATVCDHIYPKTKEADEGFFAGPFQSLCAFHHDSTKARLEAGRPVVRIGEDGWPVDDGRPRTVRA